MIYLKLRSIRGQFSDWFSSLLNIFFHKYWQPRIPREKCLLSIVFAGSVVAGFYCGVWEPFSQRINLQRSVVEQNQDILQKIKMSESAVEEWQKRNMSTNDKTIKNLSQYISESAGKYKIALNRIQVQRQDVQVSPEPLLFNELLDWLMHLRNEAGIRVTYLDIVSSEEAGKVRVVRLSLTH